MKCEACKKEMKTRGKVWVCFNDDCERTGKPTKEDTVEDMLHNAMMFVKLYATWTKVQGEEKQQLISRYVKKYPEKKELMLK